jgi:bifunctional DNA-binding transcriptional regulator/antitoxin component of YhaV-PrlF toxin-antitoxin module
MPQKYERSIIRFGDEGGCVISLPIAWLRYYNLGPGDKLDMIVNGEIIIQRKAKPENTTSKVEGPNYEKDFDTP